MDLSNKTDSEILAGLTLWVGKEREAASNVLYHLREVEERKLFLQHASSLFEFCMKVYKYSRNEAQARVDAMRLMKTTPEIAQDIDAGRLSLTVAAQLQSAFRQENARRKDAGVQLLSKGEQKIVIEDLKNTSTRNADRKLATHFPKQLPPEQTKPINEDVTFIGFNADPELKKQLDRIQAVYHHQTGGRWDKLFKILTAHEVERLDAPPRWAPRKQAAVHTRYVRKQTSQEVWSAWEQGCCHILENGERCGSRQNLQKDHIQEFAQGGRSNRDNLQLVCGAHNRYRSDQYQKLRQGFMQRIDETRSHFMGELTRHSAGRPE